MKFKLCLLAVLLCSVTVSANTPSVAIAPNVKKQLEQEKKSASKKVTDKKVAKESATDEKVANKKSPTENKSASVTTAEQSVKELALDKTTVAKPKPKLKPVADIPGVPTINARSYILIDALSGYVIAEKNADEQYSPASLTKMMTSYIVSEKLANGELNLSDKVGITRNASPKKFPGSSLMWVEVGSRVSVDDLHRGLVVSSANDAAVALAEHISNSVDNFVGLMNQKADSLGMLNTQFKNPHGLTAEGHYSSARDLAKLARAIVWDYPEDYFLYQEKTFNYNGITQSNRNTLLWSNPFVDGIKTGFTKDAGYCLVSSAKKEGVRLVAVVMGTKSEKARGWESQKLLSYGFRYFDTMSIYKAEDIVKTVRVWKGKRKYLKLGVDKDVYLTVPRGRKEHVQAEIVLEDDIVAPVQAGQQVGNIEVTWNDKTFLSEPLLAMESIGQANILSRFWDQCVYYVQKLMGD